MSDALAANLDGNMYAEALDKAIRDMAVMPNGFDYLSITLSPEYYNADAWNAFINALELYPGASHSVANGSVSWYRRDAKPGVYVTMYNRPLR